MTLGERIRNARGRLSARKLAIAAGISPSFLSDIELGKTEPSVDTLKKIASVLNVSSSFLLEETDDPTRLSSGHPQVTIETDTRIIGDPYTPPDKPEEKVTNTPTHTVVEYARGNVKCSITLAPENATPENIDAAFRRVREAVEGKS